MKSRKRSKRNRKRHAGVMRMRGKCDHCKKTRRACRRAGTWSMHFLVSVFSEHVHSLMNRECAMFRLLKRETLVEQPVA